MVKAYFVTSNLHKLNEVREILAPYGIDVERFDVNKVEIQSFDVSDVVRYAAEILKQCVKKRPLLLEDSGLYIEALRGFPGAFSRHVYETIGLRGILKLLDSVKNRKAYFKTAVACICPSGPYEDQVIIKEGIVRGNIAEEVRGGQGFGFDPIFIPEGHNKTFGEMSDEEKNDISHRARAFRAIAEVIVDRYRVMRGLSGDPE